MIRGRRRRPHPRTIGDAALLDGERGGYRGIRRAADGYAVGALGHLPVVGRGVPVLEEVLVRKILR